jgi:hypothetical protein
MEASARAVGHKLRCTTDVYLEGVKNFRMVRWWFLVQVLLSECTQWQEDLYLLGEKAQSHVWECTAIYFIEQSVPHLVRTYCGRLLGVWNWFQPHRRECSQGYLNGRTALLVKLPVRLAVPRQLANVRSVRTVRVKVPATYESVQTMMMQHLEPLKELRLANMLTKSQLNLYVWSRTENCITAGLNVASCLFKEGESPSLHGTWSALSLSMKGPRLNPSILCRRESVKECLMLFIDSNHQLVGTS